MFMVGGLQFKLLGTNFFVFWNISPVHLSLNFLSRMWCWEENNVSILVHGCISFDYGYIGFNASSTTNNAY